MANEEQAKRHFATYSEYNKVLRSWFVAFGIGGPALLLVNQPVRQRLGDCLACVALCFLLGAAAQVAIAVLNKGTSWCLYYGQTVDSFRDSNLHALAKTLSSAFWIDMTLDGFTIVAYSFGIYRMFQRLIE